MPRVVTPESARLGEHVTQAANTPFQSFDVPLLNGKAKGAQALAAGIGAVADAGIAIRNKSDERAKAKLLADQKALRAEMLTSPETGLITFQGQEALDKISGVAGMAGGPPDAKPETYNAQFQRRLAELVDNADLSDGAREDVATDQLGWETSFNSYVDEKQVGHQNAVDAQLVAGNIAGAVDTAVTKINTYGPKETKKKSAAMDEGLKIIKDAVVNSDFGMAKQKGITDPDQKKLLVKEQQSILYKGVIDSLIKSGDHQQASAMLAKQMSPPDKDGNGGALMGTAVGAELQGTLLATEKKVQAVRDFAVIRDKHGVKREGLITMHEEIMQEEDVIKRNAMLTEYSGHVSAANAKRNIENSEALTRIMTVIAKTGSFAGAHPDDMAKALTVEPLLIDKLGRASLSSSALAGKTADQQAYVRGGGSDEPSDTINSHYKTMAKNKPQQFIDIMNDPAAVKAGVSFEQYNGLKELKIDAQTKIDNLEFKSDFALDSYLNKIGYNKGDTLKKNRRDLLGDSTLKEAINIRRREVFKKEGRDANDSEIGQIVAEHALKVSVDVEWSLFDKKTMYTLTEAEQRGDKIDDMPLLTGKHNVKIMGIYFGVPDVEVTAAIKRLDDAGLPTTIGNLKGNIGKLTQSVPRSLQEAQGIDGQNSELSIAAGYSPGFIKWAVTLPRVNDNGETVAGQYTPGNVRRAIQIMQKNPKYYAIEMRKYLQ